MTPEEKRPYSIDAWVMPAVLIGASALAVFAVFAVSLAWYGSWLDTREARTWQISNGNCNIAVVPIQGDIVAYDGFTFYEGTSSVTTPGDWFVRYLLEAEANPHIWGALVQIDSYGGLAAPALQMASAMQKSPLPVLAYIREMGTSGAYLAATGADSILASPFASVGSIGITYSYLENSEHNENEGLTFVQLSSGKFKDTGNPNKSLTAEERELYERDIALFKDVFVNLVAASRGLTKEEVERLADGSSMPASLALESGLIDNIGDEDTARQWFADEFGVLPEDIVFCN